MGKLIFGKKIIFMFPLFVIVLLTILLTPVKYALVFQHENSGKVLAYIVVSEEDAFQIKYTHSIHLSDVIESYVVTKDREIKLVELTYEDFAIGMPENASDGEKFEYKDGKYYIKNMKRLLPYFDLRIGKVRANHIVIYDNREYPLSRYMEPGTWVRIKVERINIIQQLKGVNMGE